MVTTNRYKLSKCLADTVEAFRLMIVLQDTDGNATAWWSESPFEF